MAEQELIRRFCKLNLTGSQGERFSTDANSLLDELISFGHWIGRESKTLTEQELNAFVTYGCRQLEGKGSLLKSKFANVIYLFLTNQQKTLDADVSSQITPFLMSSIGECPTSLKVGFLQALGSVVYGNGANLASECFELVIGSSSCLWPLLDLTQKNYSIHGEVIQCIGNLCIKSSNGSFIDKSFIKMLYHKVKDFLRGLLTVQDEKSIDLYKLVARTLKVLQTVMTAIHFQDAIIDPDFDIALLRVYLVYGLPGFQNTVAHLSTNLPSAGAGPVFDPCVFTKKAKSPLIKQAGKKKKKSKKSASKKQLHFHGQGRNEDPISAYRTDQFNTMSDDSILSFDGSAVSNQSSSESEFSDSESGFQCHLRNTWCRIRQNSLKCIHDILKCFDRRGKLSSWLLLVPEASSDLEPSLIVTCMYDMSTKVRLLSLACLIELFNNSRPVLEAAVDRSQSHAATGRSFVPFSVKLNQSLITIHEAFLQRLKARKNDATTDKCLQCLSVLVLNTPYDKIGFEQFYDALELVTNYVTASDLNVKISSLTCLAAAMSVRPNDERIYSLMSVTPKTLVATFSAPSKQKQEFGSWIVRYCYQELARDDLDSTHHERICNQSLQVLKIVMQFYPELASSNERKSIISLISQRYIKMAECMIAFHSIKLIEEFGKHFAKTSIEKKETSSEALEFWNSVLDGPLVRLFQSPNCVPKILSAACDALSTISADLFDALNIRYQIMCKTLLLGAATDEENSIKSAAVRALGIFVMYPFVKEDESFITDVGRVIFTQLQSPFLNVRLKAGWALGNFTDSLIQNKSLANSEDVSPFPSEFVLELLDVSKQAALDHDKVKPNGVRAVGNVLRWIPQTMADDEAFQPKITESVDSLTQNILTGPMKGRWNACYASSNMFQSESIHLGKTAWTERILMALVTSLKECKNFKVRISAAIALCTPKIRDNFGDNELFNKIWKLVVESLKSSEELSDFTEFKFKDNLQSKIAMLLCHLLNLASPVDLDGMQVSIKGNSDIIQLHMGKFIDSVVNSKNDDDTDEASFQRAGVIVKELNQNLTKLHECSAQFALPSVV